MRHGAKLFRIPIPPVRNVQAYSFRKMQDLLLHPGSHFQNGKSPSSKPAYGLFSNSSQPIKTFDDAFRSIMPGCNPTKTEEPRKNFDEHYRPFCRPISEHRMTFRRISRLAYNACGFMQAGNQSYNCLGAP